MKITPFEAMQAAVDIVNDSEHLNNKISACVFDKNTKITRVNHRPELLSSNFDSDQRIGKSSQYVHSEVACIFAFNGGTENASLCVTDPFCPDCAKAIVEAGIKHVYIDHKGLDKDFAIRRGEDFENISLFIAEKAGINVSILHRKERKITPLLLPKIITRPAGSAGIEFFDTNDSFMLEDIVHSFRTRQAHGSWACAKVREPDGKTSGLLVFESLPNGITPQEFDDKKDISGKYTLTIDSVRRLYFYMKRKNLTLLDDHIGVNLFPSSRALVDSVGFGIKTITIGEDVTRPGLFRHDAADILEKNRILCINRLYS